MQEGRLLLDERSDTQDLVERAKRGNRRAFGELDKRYRDEVTKHCGRILYNEQDKEDAVQETFTRAWRSIHTFDGRSHFSGWLYRVAENVCWTTLKKKYNISRTELQVTVTVEPPAPGKTPEVTAIETMEWERMREAVFRKGETAKPPWDDTDRIIYHFSIERGEGHATIAERLHMNESAVKQRYYRKILPVLKEFYDEGEGDEGEGH